MIRQKKRWLKVIRRKAIPAKVRLFAPGAGCLAFLVSIILSQTALAFTPNSFEYLKPAEHLTISEAIQRTDWVVGHGHPSFGFQIEPVWIRWQVPPEQAADVFVVQNAWLDEFELFLVGNGRPLASFLTGGGYPLNTRAVSHPEFVFPLAQDRPVTEVYVYNEAAANAVLYPVAFMTWEELASYTGRLHGLHGIFFGVLGIMLVYNLAIFFSVRARAYLYLVAYAASLLMVIAASDGFGQLYVWGGLEGAQTILTSIGLSLVPITLGQFCLYFLELGPQTPTAYRSIRTLQCIAGANGLLMVLFEHAPGARLEPLILLAGAILFLTIGIWRSLQGHVPARVFLIANGSMCATSMIMIATHLAWIPATRFGMHAVLLGSTFEFALLSLALGWRLSRQQHLQRLLKERSQGLARRVRELQAATSLAEEHRQLQKSMQHAQKLKTIGQMAGGIAHDFNNILATILGFTELALDRSAQADRQRLVRYLTEIRQAGERGANLVKQLLTYSRGSQATRTEVELRQALEETITLVRGSLPATIQIHTEMPKNALQIRLDPSQVQQMLVNLCLNASEAMRNRGTITIRLEERTVRDLQCSSCLNRFDGTFATITVEDTGAGIKGQVHELFTPFFTSKPVGQGSGLGLSVVHGIAHEHSGHLHGANRATGGSRFTLYLPLTSASQVMAAVGQRILLIEDDPAMARYLETLLADQSYLVTMAALPTEALEKFVARPDSFDLVVANQLMPKGTGLEVARDMLALRPDLPVIITTGNPDQIGSDELLLSGVRAVFGKPIESELLLAKIAGLLKKKAAT